MDLETKMRTELTRWLVQRAITCPFTGKVLDYRTCAIVLDADGDPYMVMSPEAGQVLADEGLPIVLSRKGYTLVTQ